FRPLWGQGVTTAAMSGVVAAKDGTPLADATIVAVHVPSGTQYRAVTRTGGAYNVPNMRVGGPYRVTATRIGYKSHAQEGVFLSLGQDLRVDFALEPQAIELEAVEAAGQRDPVLNPGRTGAATFIDPEKVALLPSVKRSTPDLDRVTATRIGYKSHAQEGVFLSLGQDLRVDFALEPQAIELEAVEAAGQRDPVLNPGRTGAATFIDPEKVALLPSVKRSTRDLIRVDPRNDGNYSFSGRNWLY